MKYFPALIIFLCFCTTSCAQKPNDIPETSMGQNANTLVIQYTDQFLYGSNMAWFNNNWRDEDVADFLIGNPGRGWEGVGVNSLRPALYYDFVENWGYGIRIDAFKHYYERGAKNNVVFIGDRPSDEHREKRQYAPGLKSESYENLYEPIWVDNEKGTVVNENNYYALYVYNLVQRYKNYVKFWEIKNEPDFTYTSCGGKSPGEDCNWWTKDPLPSDLNNFRAPIQSYIRMLRVSYEVIKHLDPDAYVCVGGIGYASFLDAVLRNTDNPDNGKVTDRYPHTGGAWFDCLSFHIYPMYYLRRWGNGGFDFFRHTDAAIAAVENQTNEHVDMMKKYGYGREYPAKEIIITETNIPSKQVGDWIGSIEAQRNYLVKLAVAAQRIGIIGIHVYGAADDTERDDPNGNEYHYMGFYKPIPNTPAGTLRMNESGIAWRTASRILGGRKYDAAETARLNLPSGIDGGAFYSASARNYVYVLWAKTTKDMNEESSATYSFPASMNVVSMKRIGWNENETGINGNAITLGGSPVYIITNPTNF